MRSGAAVLLLVSVAASIPGERLGAQEEIRVGPMIGISNAGFRGEDAGDTQTRTSFLAGGFLSFLLNPQVALQPELLYTRKGARANIEDFTGRISLDYIEIPLLVQVRFPSQRWTPYFTVGPAFAFRAACSFSLETSQGEFSDDCGDLDVGVKETDFSLIGGIGVEIDNVLGSLRYDHGLTSLPDAGTASIYNRTFSLTLGYAFRLGR